MPLVRPLPSPQPYGSHKCSFVLCKYCLPLIVALSQWRAMHWKPKPLLFSYLWPLLDRGCHVEYVHVANECCKVAKQFSLERMYTSMCPVDFARVLSWMGGRESKILGSSEAHNLNHVYPSCVQQQSSCASSDSLCAQNTTAMKPCSSDH